MANKPGTTQYTHKGKQTTTPVGSAAWDFYLMNINYNSFNIGTIPLEYEYRPDLISSIWYGGTLSWWEVMAVNGFVDPFESLNPGAQILLPKI